MARTVILLFNQILPNIRSQEQQIKFNVLEDQEM